MRRSRRLSSPSAIASCEESSQVATSPCCQRNLLDVILRIFPWLPGPLPRRSHRVHAPVDFPDVIGLPPRKDGLASRFIPRTRLFVGEFSRLQTFRYVQAPKFVCLPDRSHRYGNAIGRPRLLHPGRTCFVASARTGYASRPKQAIDGTRTCTLLDPQHCRLLPFPPHSPPTMFRLCSNDSSVSGRRRRTDALASVRRSNCTYTSRVMQLSYTRAWFLDLQGCIQRPVQRIQHGSAGNA
jgi:hypothetical protein